MREPKHLWEPSNFQRKHCYDKRNNGITIELVNGYINNFNEDDNFGKLILQKIYNNEYQLLASK
jgi:hypothetical protein